MTRRERLLRGLTANGISLIVRIAVQFAALPLLFAYWSTERVGAWLMLFAVPAQIAMLGAAFAAAGGNVALAATQRGDADAARAAFACASALAGLVAAVLAALLVAAVLLAAALEPEWLVVAPGAATGAAAWLALYVVASVGLAMIEIPFRTAGRYADHMQIANAAMVAELPLFYAVPFAGGGVEALAMALAVMRIAALGGTIVAARRVAPALFARTAASASAPAEAMPRFVVPALTLALLPLVIGLNLQGYLLLVGAAAGAAAAAAFAATRTLTRLLDLATNMAYSLQFYEAGYETGDRREAQRRQLATMSVVALAAAAAFSAVLLVAGPPLQTWYTHGQTAFDRSLAAVLLLAAAIRALAAAPMALLVAENRQAGVVAWYVAASLAGLGLAGLLGIAGAPLVWVAAPLLLAEAGQTVPALAAALRLTGTGPRRFAVSLASRERCHDLAALAMLLRERR